MHSLWDFAGQPDSRIINQLFLNDINVAILLFNGNSSNPFNDVSYWLKVLEKQAPKNYRKYLVASRADICPVAVDQAEIEQFVKKNSINGYFVTSAKEGNGVEELLKNILEDIFWEKLPRITTPKLFQIIRDYLLEKQSAGDELIQWDQIEREIGLRHAEYSSIQAEVETVVGLLQKRGLVYRLDPTPGLALILLRPELINKYASVIINAARNHPDGVGTILERDIVTARLPFDGFSSEERLPSHEEKLILESTVELFIRNNLAFREMGRLIFPSQLRVRSNSYSLEHPSAEVFYEFSGSVEAIYASLVVCLNYTHDFHLENLWNYAAEFSRDGSHLGFFMQEIGEGLGKLEIYFYTGVNDFDRVTFIRFICSHLHSKGIDLHEYIRLYCPNLECVREVTNREAIETRVKAGKLEIFCQFCDAAVLIPPSIEEKYRSERSYQEKQKELQDTVEQRTKQEIQEFRQDHQQYMANSDQLVRILHLSDIHLGTVAQSQRYFTQIATDLTQNLHVKQLSYLVISGDIANRSTESEYEAAFDFLDKLVKRYGLDPSRVVVVPGNHDLNWDLSESAYAFVPRSKLPDPLPQARYISAGNAGALICNDEEYRKRFNYFSEHFYKKVYGKPFPVNYDNQAILHPCPQDKILFLTLNSSWEIDHEYRDRAGIHPNAIANALDQILTEDYDDWLKIAVWHHPVTTMKDVAFLEQLAVHGFQIGMHGHIHEAKDETFQYDTNRGLRIIAAGTFGAPTKEQVTGIPLQYNLLALNPSTGELTVETRKKEKVDGAWSADARWGDKNNPVPRYVIPLRYNPNNAMSGTSKDSATTNNENNAPQPQQSIFNNVRVGGNLTTGNITQSYNSETRSFPAQSTQPSSSKHTILILAASPTDQGRLNLGIEVRNIDEGLRLSPQRDQFELKQSWAVRVDDLRRALLDFNPEIVHFCGHGLGTGGLAFENSAGQTQLVSTNALAGLFRLFSNHVRCVVLNACYSEVQARAIAEHIEHVVGMRDAIGQSASTRFSIGFYDAVVRGRSVEDAYAFGCNAIAEYNIPEEDIPVLLKKPS
jgi:predicted MPP superfamily phosphohydrolase